MEMCRTVGTQNVLPQSELGVGGAVGQGEKIKITVEERPYFAELEKTARGDSGSLFVVEIVLREEGDSREKN